MKALILFVFWTAVAIVYYPLLFIFKMFQALVLIPIYWYAGKAVTKAEEYIDGGES